MGRDTSHPGPDPAGEAPAPHARDTTPVVVWASLAAALMAVVAVGAWRGLRTDAPSRGEIADLGTLPSFALVERSGRALTDAELARHVWIADFVFTRCGGLCPVLSSRMAALRKALDAEGGADVLTVSISVDPMHDRPAVLSEYADRLGADPARWLFATGARPAVEGLVRDGFKLAIAEVSPEERDAVVEPITHSDRFVLVDRGLRIRGYYHGMDAESVARLRADAAALAAGS